MARLSNITAAFALNEGMICLSKKLVNGQSIQHCERAFLRVLHAFPANSRARANLGFTYFQLEKFEKAVQEFTACPSDNSIVGLYLGLALTEIELQNRAIKAWRSANASPYFFFQGEFSRQKGTLDNAVQMYRRAILIDPYYEDARIALGEVYIDLTEYAQVEILLEDSEINISTAHEYFLLGYALFRLWKTEKAEKAFLNALSIDPVSYEALWWLGQVYWRQKRWKDALEIFRPLSIGSPKGIFCVGAMLDKLGDRAAALQSFLNGIDMDPKYTANYFGAAEIYERRDQIEKAIIMYEKVLLVEPDNQFAQDKVQDLRYAQK